MTIYGHDVAFRPAGHPGRFLCSTFRRGDAFITCELDITGIASYEVWLLPHWNLDAAEMEHFVEAEGALERHAEVAERLESSGWEMVTKESAS